MDTHITHKMIFDEAVKELKLRMAMTPEERAIQHIKDMQDQYSHFGDMTPYKAFQMVIDDMESRLKRAT